jgi:hypothetical protein
MDELRIKDSYGDSFVLSDVDGGAYLLQASESGVVVVEPDAHAMVDWLRERFGLAQELEAIGEPAPGLAIDVETETGKTRSVRWYGPDMPGELIKLAEIALRVAPETTAHDCKYLHMVTDLLEIMHGAGVRSTSASLVEDVRELARRVSRPAPAPAPGELAALRQVMGTLGCERVSEAPERVQGLVQELDSLAQDISRMAGVEIGPDGANLRALLDKIQARHREAIANTLTEAERKHHAFCTYRQRLQRQATAHDEFRRSVPMQIESALSTERNARAAVQAELDAVRKQGMETRRQLVAEQRAVKLQRELLESIAEATVRAGVEDAPDTIAAIQELGKANQQNAATAADALGKLEKAREALHDMRYELCQGEEIDTPWSDPRGAVTVDNAVVATWHRRIGEALKVSDPGA